MISWRMKWRPPRSNTGAPENQAFATPVIAVRHTRTGSNGGNAQFPGEPVIGLGRVDGGLLMPHVDDPDPLLDAAVEYRDDVAAGEGEDRVDSLIGERPGDNLSAVNLGHGEKIAASSHRPVPSNQYQVTSSQQPAASTQSGHSTRSDRPPVLN